MTHSRIPKFTPSRPWGTPKTPFNPKSGKFVALGKERWTVGVVVERKISGSEHLYVCAVLDERHEKSGERIHAHRLVLSSSAVEDIAEDTVTFAYYIDKKWWIRGEEDSTYAYVDFIVEEFDRDDADSIGDYWENNAKWSIRNQRGYESGSTSTFTPTYGLGYLSTYARIPTYGGFMTWTTLDPPYPTSRIQLFEGKMFRGDSVGAVDVLYKAVLSNADHNIKIVANSSVNSYIMSGQNYASSLNFEFCTHIPSDFQDRGSRVFLIAGKREALTCPGESAGAVGYFSGSCPHGGSYSHTASWGSQSMASKQLFHARITANDDSDTKTILDYSSSEFVEDDYDRTTYGYCNSGTHPCYSRLEVERTKLDYENDGGIGDVGFSEGENTFYFEIRSGMISGWCNGNQIFKNESLYTISAGMFGLRGDYNFLTLFQTGEFNNYISRVKVWTDDVPEPPDGESGHGTYDDGQSAFNYADKYHADGDYNPDA